MIYNWYLKKTKLVAFARKADEDLDYAKKVSPISLYGQEIPFSLEAEHLGVLRASSCSNMPTLMSRMSAHRKKLFSLLPASLARHHYASPAACLRIERLYALPVLLSGLATIVLTSTELKVIHLYFKNVLRRLMKLPIDVPEEAIYFLAGSLPFKAILHLRCLSLFGMICHLPENILFKIAEASLLTAAPSHRSWFTMLRNLCSQYGLPHPLQLLHSPMPPKTFKSLSRSKVHDYWHVALSHTCNTLPSLQLLRPEFISLQKCHPIWSSLDGNPYQTKAAVIQALFLTGRYRNERLCRFWTTNRMGFCLLEPCQTLKIIDSNTHVLPDCEALSDDRRRLLAFTLRYTKDKPVIYDLCSTYLFENSDQEILVQFLTDCSILPEVVKARQLYGIDILSHLFRITRTWCRSLHTACMRKLDRFKNI